MDKSATILMPKPVHCKKCGSPYHYQSFCPLNRKPIKKRSDKQIDFDKWKETVARPYLIKKYGNICQCCKRPAFINEKLDIDHIETIGGHVNKKRDLSNLQLLCRFPCHRNKTDNTMCLHL